MSDIRVGLEGLKSYRVLVLNQVPQQSVALLTDVVQVDVSHSVAAGVLVLMDGRTCREKSTHIIIRLTLMIQHNNKRRSLMGQNNQINPVFTRPWLWLTLDQVLMVDGGQVGEVLLEVGAELSVGVDLDQLLLTARLLAVKVGHVLLRLGADLGAAAAHVVSTQHVLHHRPERGRRVL